MKIRLTPEAQSDLASIYTYTFETWGREQAHRYVNRMTTSIHHLADNPKLGKERPDIKQDMRGLVVERHVVLYRIAVDEIAVIRVISTRQDILNHLK